jgi:hypothetical protein
MAEKLLTRHSITITHSIVQYSIKSIRYIYDERKMYGFDYFITLMENIYAAMLSIYILIDKFWINHTNICAITSYLMVIGMNSQTCIKRSTLGQR